MKTANRISHYLVALTLTLFQGCFADKPFVVGDLMGQLGNQMFIIAAATSLALDNDAEPLFPSLKSSKHFDIPINYPNVLHRANAKRPQKKEDFLYIEPHYHYSPIPYKPNMVIRGWFQSEKYFVHHKEEILDLFAPSEKTLDYLQSKYSSIIEDPNTVAIHYRSYEKEDPRHWVYTDCNLNYYLRAIALFPEDTHFIVFSNRIDWCKKHFAHIPRKFTFIEKEAHYHDLYLMSLCKHQIICNSTFSWWGAYLNRNPSKIVVAPSSWFSPKYTAKSIDLIPPEWVLVDP